MQSDGAPPAAILCSKAKRQWCGGADSLALHIAPVRSIRKRLEECFAECIPVDIESYGDQVQADQRRPPLTDKDFGLVCASQVLEHINNSNRQPS